MRIPHAGHMFVFTVALAGAWWACDGNTSKTKVTGTGQSAAVQQPAAEVQKPSGQLDATLAAHAVAVKDTTQPGSPGNAGAGRVLLVLGDARTAFATNAVWLTPNAKAKIDEMFAGANSVALAASHFEIEGHTDNIGTEQANRRVGLARAEAVKQYLCNHYDIPEECIKVVSFGPDQPLGDNNTEEGRAQNRRVVIRILD